MGGHQRHHRRESLAFYAQFRQPPGIVMGQSGKLAGAVVHHPHVHARFGLAGQDFQNAAPHHALVDDEVLHKNEFFGLFQFGQQPLPLFLAQSKIGHLDVLIHRVAAVPVNVPGQRRRAGVLFFQGGKGFGLRGQGAAGEVYQLGHPGLFRPVPQIAAHQPEQKRPCAGRGHDDDQPGDLGGGVHAGVEQIQHHHRREQRRAADEVGQQPGKPGFFPKAAVRSLSNRSGSWCALLCRRSF